MINKRRGSALPELVTVQILILAVLLLNFSALAGAANNTFSQAGSALQGDGVEADSFQMGNAEHTVVTREVASSSWNKLWIAISILFVMAVTTGLHIAYRRHQNNLGFKKRRDHKEANSDVHKHLELPSERLKDKREQVADILSDNWKSMMDNKLTVRHFMTDTVTVVAPRDSIKKIRELVQDKQFRHLIVRNASSDVVGVISDRDEILDGDRRAEDVMSRNPIVVHQDIPVMSAVSQMIANRISCLPVVGNEGLVGILTTSDIMIAFQCTLRTVEKIRQTIHTEIAGSTDSVAMKA